MKIAEALLLRKQLADKVQQLSPLRISGDNGVFTTEVKRVAVGEGVDEATIKVPRVTLADITASYDHYAGELRKVDAAIQQANWLCDVDYAEKAAPVQK